jgi:hypothetical protein
MVLSFSIEATVAALFPLVSADNGSMEQVRRIQQTPTYLSEL